jgi:hypothetical protein
MRRSVKLLLCLFAIALVSACAPPSNDLRIEYYQPHPPAWFIGTWRGETETKEYQYTFKVESDSIVKEVMHAPPKTSIGVVSTTITHYHGFNGKYVEQLKDTHYELRPEARIAAFEEFSLNASGSIDYTFSHDGNATQSLVLEKR